MKRFNLSRRTFMKSAAGGFAVSAMGAPFGAQQAFAAGLADQELRTVGLSVTVQERILADFKAKSGVKGGFRQGRDLPGHANGTAFWFDSLRLLGDDRRASTRCHRDQQDRAHCDVRA